MIYDTINDAVTISGNGEGTLLAGRYRIVRQLGQGGMGSVWLAEDMQLDNKPFAIKMLPAILVANKRAYRQLKDEALVAMKLTHPNIVTLRAFEENSGNPFLVMDYVDGQSLDDYLADKGKLSEDDVLRVLRPIAAALDYAHGEGVVHRDVKPGNVMIRKDGRPFILDFGIAREIQETITRMTGRLLSGSLLYMSPEQLNGELPRSSQDVYSFAAMVYECLKGEPPFVRGQIEYQILNNPPPSLQGSPQLVASIMAGLAKKPEDRPPICAAVLGGENSPLSVMVPQNENMAGCSAPSAETARKPARKRVQLWAGGPYWAETNIGAEEPWEFGYYFWWGDTVGYKRENNTWVASDGSSSDLSFYSEHTPTLAKKPSRLQREGWITVDNVLAPQHDAAQMQWGDGWRMPTIQELVDLCNKCDWIWTTMNCVDGYDVCGRGDYASASIFLPAAACDDGTSFKYTGGSGHYWSTVPTSFCNASWALYFHAGTHRARTSSRNIGQSVRPVQGLTK